MDSQTLAGLANIFTAVVLIIASIYYFIKWHGISWRMAACLTAITIALYTVVSYAWVLKTAVPSPVPPPLNVVLLRPIFSLWHAFVVAILIALDIREESVTDAECRKKLKELEYKLLNKVQAIEDRDRSIHLLHEKIDQLKQDIKTK